MIDYPNVPFTIATIVSAEMATLHELNTVYGIEDLHDMLEILSVDRINESKMNKWAALEARQNRG